MFPFRTKYPRHLMMILLGAFLFSVPAYSANLGFSIDPTTPVQFSAFSGKFQEQTRSGYNNQLKCWDDNYGLYYVKIKASGDLTSPGKTPIPIANMKWMCPYINIYNNVTTASHSGQGTYFIGSPTYTGFSTSFNKVYLTATNETTPSAEVQPQFKFAIDVPGNQAPGVYSGQITFRITPLSNEDVVNVDKTLNISIEVLPLFQLLIDRGTIDFETMLPGKEKDNVPVEGIIVTALTSNNNPWFLKISDNSPLTSGPHVIPNANFMWYGWTDGSGRWYGTGDDALSQNPQLCYSSGAGESSNAPDGTLNHFKFKLKVPAKQRPGRYMSVVKFTLTE